MRISRLFGKSIRSVSAEVKSRGLEYLLRGGFIRESSSGRFYMLPLGIRVQDKLVSIIEEELDLIGAQKMLAPVLHPLELWEETARSASVSFELMQVKDRNQRSFVLGGTAEEMMVALVRQFVVTAKDLPFCIYQFSTKFRDELRARGGMLRAREFLMKDGYSFHATGEDFESYYQQMMQCYRRIFERLGLNVRVVEADNGYMGGDYCHEFVVDHDLGESRYLVSDDGSYCMHEDIATFSREMMNADEVELAMVEVAAGRGVTIQAGVEFYQQPAWRQIKSLIYITETGDPILVAIRGDLEINESKLKRVVGCYGLRLADEKEVQALGSVVGFVSPLKLKIRRVGDVSLTTVRNFYTGADQWQRDTLNVNYGRDFVMDTLADIGMAEEGYVMEGGSAKLRERRGIEVGNIFQLGSWYSDRMEGASFVGSDGKKHPYYMGCYGIGVGRTLATIAELNNDEQGLSWDEVTSPYRYHLVAIGRDEETIEFAEELYQHLINLGRSVLFDDRDVSPGIKFADADLIGISKRLVVSKRLIAQGGIELQLRSTGDRIIVDRSYAF